MNKDKPTLSVSYTEPAQSCGVLDTVAGNPLGFPLYVRGSLSDWNAQPAYQLSYKGMEGNLAIYQAAFNYAGSFDFKFANDDGNWSKQFFVKDAVAFPDRTGAPSRFTRSSTATVAWQQHHAGTGSVELLW